MKIRLCNAAFLLWFSLQVSLAAEGYRMTEDGIIVQIDPKSPLDVSTVRLRVITDRIIQVTATPAREIPEKKSLITVDLSPAASDWQVSEEPDWLIVQTPSLRACVSRSTGQVVFTDADGKVLLSETHDGGKTFTPIRAEGKTAWSLRQVFDSPAEEAFYGLGQHQADEFNYKGKNEVLFQYNTKVSVPFIVSSQNYGLLWDNYSLTKFGDPRDYAELDQFDLYDSAGEPGGLTATYLVKADPEQVHTRRLERQIDYENLETVEKFPAGFPFNDSRIVWEGEIEPPESGLYRFILYYAGYTTVSIDDRVVVQERWRTAWNPNSYKFAVPLEAGKRHKIKVDWKPDGGVSYIGLKALGPRPDEEQNRLSLWSEMGDAIDYYFIYGQSMDEIIGGYRTLTGKSQIMPKWAMGFWQSRERYKTQDELLSVLRSYRERRIPIDNIVLDWSYWPVDGWGSHDFDPERFPDPEGMIDSVHVQNARIMISVWPKFYHTTEHYKAFERNGWMYDRAVKDSIRDWIGKGYIAGFYDAYSEGARKLFWQQMNDKLYCKGIDAWWMDASEPDILSNASLSYRKALSTPTALGSSTEYLNAYALVNAQAIYEGQRSVNPNARVFLLTRSGFAGLQRYSTATWSGDIGTRWEDMKAQISAGLNFALSGIPYWTMDIGGFCVEKRYEKAQEGSEDREEWRELNTRWFQFGAFCPLFRSHGQFPYREIYHIAPEDHPAYRSMVHYTRLRYRLMPYIYSLAGMTYWNDYTIMRALVMDFSHDPQTRDIGDQYLFGPALMAAPVYRYKSRTREVYFPARTGWYDFHTGDYIYIENGGWKTVEAPYEWMPMYVRAGSVIPVGPEIQHTAESTDGSLTLMVFAGQNGEFVLYEDEGTNYNYENGACSRIGFSYHDARKRLTVSDRTGSFAGMSEKRLLRIVYITPSTSAYRDIQTAPIQEVVYTGEALEIDLNRPEQTP
ncbi:MAG: DUF5110 domain-containing protein [Rikenellaceae bacterium]|nr:DUF5110 domain-containing protein [Rikenellaceae bacterium]